MQETNNTNKFKREFFTITMIPPFRPVNKLEDNFLRKDIIFTSLAEKIFDNPRLLDLLSRKIDGWLKLEQDELIFSLAGYINYFKEEFPKAEKYFLKAINENPENLDNWFDLAFSLYHQGDKKHNLAKKILFNFDYCIKFFRNRGVNLRALEKTLENLKEFINAGGR